MKSGDQVKLKVDVKRGMERFKKGDILTLKVYHGKYLSDDHLWGVKETNVGFYESEMELYWDASSLIDRKPNGEEVLIACKGGRVIVKCGESQGVIGIVKEWDETGKLYLVADSIGGGDIGFYVDCDDVRIWREKDDDICMKFKKLFALMNTNKTTLELRKKENFVKALIDQHVANMRHVKYKFDKFLYHEEFSKEDIRKLNEIWKIEKKSQVFYADPKWVYDGNVPTGYEPKYSIEEYRTLMNFEIPNAHAVIHTPST